MKYIMITHFSGHWNRCKGGKTFYSLGMLKPGVSISSLKENTETIFIKINEETRQVEQVWQGKANGFIPDNVANKIYFNVHISSVPIKVHKVL